MKLQSLVEKVNVSDIIVSKDKVIYNLEENPDKMEKTSDTPTECRYIWDMLGEIANKYPEFNVFCSCFLGKSRTRIKKQKDSYIIRLLKDSALADSNLTKLRQKAGLTQQQLAFLSGVNIKNIQRYEREPSTILTAQADNIKKLSNALDCDINKLLEPGTPIYPIESLISLDAAACINHYIENVSAVIINGSQGSGKNILTKSIMQNYMNTGTTVSSNMIIKEDVEDIVSILYILMKQNEEGKRYVREIYILSSNGTNKIYDASVISK